MSQSISTYETGKVDYEVSLINYVGQAVVINELVVEFNLYEDLYSPFMKLDVVVVDSIGLTENFPLIGDEIIVLSFKPTGTEANFITVAFDVYQVSDKKPVTDRSYGYVIHGISREGMTNAVVGVNKPYVNVNIGDAVTAMYKELKSDKELFVEPTENNFSIIGYYDNPAYLIGKLAKEARSEKYKESSFYLFYEDRDRFNFRTLSSLFEQEPVLDFYLTDPQTTSMQIGNADFKPFQTISAITFKRNFDTLSAISNGTIRNDALVIDPITKRYELDSRVFDYFQNFEDLPHMVSTTGTFGNPQGGAPFFRKEGKIGQSLGGGNTRMLISQIEKDNVDYSKDGYLDGKTEGDLVLSAARKRHTIIPNSVHQIQNLGLYSVDITVVGNPDLVVGNIINIFLPQPSDIDSEYNQYLRLFGQLSPKFIITAARHKYDNLSQTYVTVLSCSKESFGQRAISQYADNADQELDFIEVTAKRI